MKHFWACRVLIFALVSCYLCGCEAVVSSQPEAKQIATSANIHTLSIQIARAAAENGGDLSGEFIASLISEFGTGRDEWGREFIFVPRRDSGQLDFLLISRGSDGELDVDSVYDYFDAPRKDVTGNYEADLFNRNKERIQLAGK